METQLDLAQRKQKKWREVGSNWLTQLNYEASVDLALGMEE